MPTFKKKNFLAVLCNHSESDFYYLWQVDCRSAVAQIQPICYVTSAIFANDVTSVYADFC